MAGDDGDGRRGQRCFKRVSRARRIRSRLGTGAYLRYVHGMTEIDQFESVFKAADKTPFAYEAVAISTVLIVTDVDATRTRELGETAAEFLRVLGTDVRWKFVGGDDFSGVGNLLEEVEAHRPDLICTYRNLRIPVVDLPHSLGVYVDVLTQATTTPVLLLPHPDLTESKSRLHRGTQTVMAITDHLTGDQHLVSYAAKLTAQEGNLWLTHVEDEAVFERYMTTISKIASVDTDTAREEIRRQLLKEPHDYIRSCREVLAQLEKSFEIQESVTLGHHLTDYRRLVEEHNVDLLVMNTKDEDQLAMHGVAYPLSVELRDLPLLLL